MNKNLYDSAKQSAPFSREILSSLTEPTDIDLIFGGKIRALRKKKKLNQTEVGAIIGVSQVAICRIEAGFQSLRPWQLHLVCRLFDVNFDYFFEGSSSDGDTA